MMGIRDRDDAPDCESRGMVQIKIENTQKVGYLHKHVSIGNCKAFKKQSTFSESSDAHEMH